MMERHNDKRQLAIVAVSVPTFQQRLKQITEEMGGVSTGVLSRLALVHQAAKELAVEALGKKGGSTASVDVEELTNPPLFDFYPEDEPVVIYYSYLIR